MFLHYAFQNAGEKQNIFAHFNSMEMLLKRRVYTTKDTRVIKTCLKIAPILSYVNSNVHTNRFSHVMTFKLYLTSRNRTQYKIKAQFFFQI